MAWWNDYDRELRGSRDRDWRGTDRSPWNPGRYPERGYGRELHGSARRNYEMEYRRPPRQSPAYGRAGDERVRRWAQRYGYDEGYEIQPRRGGMFRGDRWSERPPARWWGGEREGRYDWGYWW